MGRLDPPARLDVPGLGRTGRLGVLDGAARLRACRLGRARRTVLDGLDRGLAMLGAVIAGLKAALIHLYLELGVRLEDARVSLVDPHVAVDAPLVLDLEGCPVLLGTHDLRLRLGSGPATDRAGLPSNWSDIHVFPHEHRARRTDDHPHVADVGVVLDRASVPVNHDDALARLVVAADVHVQAEGGITMGLGHTLRDSIRFKGGEVQDDNFDTYHLPRFSSVPRIESVFVDDREAPPQGGGEPAIITVGASVANAVYDAIGTRMYRLPMSPARTKQALAAR